MSGYLKRYAAPRSWPVGIQKKGGMARQYAIRPAAGPHPADASIPLGVMLSQKGYVRTRRETVKVLNNSPVLVDGRRIKDLHFPIGLMDTVSIPGANFHARVGQDAKGRITLTDISAADAKHKPCKIVRKGIVPGGRVQLGLFDGRSILVAAKEAGHYAVGDTLVLELPAQKVHGHMKLEKGVRILIIGGRQRGKHGIVEAVDGQKVRYAAEDGESGETQKQYVFVMPTK
jgi:small subunit ribosomal protein S4e